MVWIKVNQTELSVESLQPPQTRLNSCNVCGRWMTTELIQLTNDAKAAEVGMHSVEATAESGTREITTYPQGVSIFSVFCHVFFVGLLFDGAPPFLLARRGQAVLCACRDSLPPRPTTWSDPAG